MPSVKSDNIYFEDTKVNKMYLNGALIYQNVIKPEAPQEPNYFAFDVKSDGSIGLYGRNIEKTIEVKINDGDWITTSFTEGSINLIPVYNGDTVYFRGDNATYATGSSAYCMFSGGTSDFEVKGNIMSLVQSQGFETATTISESHFMRSLFQGNKHILNAENLIIPITAVTDNCFKSTFSGCTNLQTAPSVLPATVLTESCYSQMFYNCSALTSVPALPATTLAINCYYQMFRGCSLLTTAPELPATTLANNCYNGMFQGCTSLNYIKCLATDISETNCTRNWVSGVAASGTFVKNPNMSGWTTDQNGIPNGWTVIDAT